MRKQKINPSLEVAAGSGEINVVLGRDAALESQERAEVASLPTGLHESVQVLANKAHTIEADVAVTS